MRAALLAAAILTMATPAAGETIHLFAAGSLKAALGEIIKAYETASGHAIEARYGPSGLLKDEIAQGASADVFASANMEHPRALTHSGRSGVTLRFARNSLCALVKPGLAVDSDSLLDRMLDPAVKLATSTPKADPSGDYAFEVFEKAEAIRAGAKGTLEKKALQLTGGAASAQPPGGRTPYGWHVAEGRADIFLTYCTNAQAARKENPGQQVIALPDKLSVGADYGLTVITGAGLAAQQFAGFIMSTAGQKILTDHGFASGL